MRHGGDSTLARMKSMVRTMSSATLPHASLLWDLKVECAVRWSELVVW
jgi:hypothetical protein